MRGWSAPAFGGAVFIAIHYLFVRAASGKIGDRLGALTVEATAALGIAMSLCFGNPEGGVVTTRAGVGFAAVAGLAISFSSVLLLTALRRGGPVASTGTIVLGGGVAMSALVAPLLFREALTLRRTLGVAFGVAAMWLLGGESW